mgnify:CR=1 FL=1|tara:strand:- start:2985 stop:3122 length:138 start_codon:yes stop_codon:yes gene_type:complete
MNELQVLYLVSAKLLTDWWPLLVVMIGMYAYNWKIEQKAGNINVS